MNKDNKSHWLDSDGLDLRLWKSFCVILVGVLIAEFFVEHHHKGFMFNFGFHAWFGFLLGSLCILFSKAWKNKLKRKDNYYDE